MYKRQGYGGVKAGEVITESSRKIKAPIITTGKNFEAFEWNYEGLTGSASVSYTHLDVYKRQVLKYRKITNGLRLLHWIIP